MKKNHVWMIEHLSIYETEWKPWAFVRNGARKHARDRMKQEKLCYSGKFRLRKYVSE